MQYLWYYLLLINALGLLFMRIDKRRAQKHLLRIPELVLIGTAFIGGSLGILIGMIAFQHKTRHLFYLIVMPVLPAVQLLFVILWRVV